MGRRRLFIPRALAGLAIVVALVLAPLHGLHADPFSLESIEKQVATDYAGVRQLSTDALARMLDDGKGGDILLFDVREREEYAVSRITGAERVDPGIWQWTFMRRYGDRVKGKTIVFYCSVGVRSSKLAASFGEALKARGARAVTNLEGGIFAWHNEGRPLVNAKGATSFVHPYDRHWGQLLSRKTLARYMPGE